MMNSKTTAIKAKRLPKNHRVILVAYGHALVIGDQYTQDVNKFDHRRTCNPWRRHESFWTECPRLQAVHRILKEPANQLPVDRIAEMLHNATYIASRKESA